MILHFDDGSSAFFENVENGHYKEEDNWKEGKIAGKAVEKWTDHTVRWTSDRVKA